MMDMSRSEVEGLFDEIVNSIQRRLSMRRKRMYTMSHLMQA
jgi:hypothetical protein